MTSRADTANYLEIFLNDSPLLDVRAPVEFDRGSFPLAWNVPLLDDQQREEIGKKYKDAGQDEAIELGLRLATPEIRKNRFDDWKKFIESHPQGYLFCFRGGLRSRTTQAWLREQGIDYPLIQGGYKAMRSFLIDQLQVSRESIPLVILSGMTGSGKTQVLRKTRFHVDLEGLANHKGSAFGRDARDWQPGQIDFENRLSIELLKHRHRHPGQSVLLEDEGRLIGRLSLPHEFYQTMAQSPRIFLERDISQRIVITRQEYLDTTWPDYLAVHGEEAQARFSEFVLNSLNRIRKRLGGERYKNVEASFQAALKLFFETGDFSGFDEGIKILLVEYYDPMYQYQLSQKPVETLFSGSESDILEWYSNHTDQREAESA